MTPSEWLLGEHDRLAALTRRVPTCHERPMFEVLDDHRTECGPVCRSWSTPATWPEPRDGNRITPTYSDTATFREVLATARHDIDGRNAA